MSQVGGAAPASGAPPRSGPPSAAAMLPLPEDMSRISPPRLDGGASAARPAASAPPQRPPPPPQPGAGFGGISTQEALDDLDVVRYFAAALPAPAPRGKTVVELVVILNVCVFLSAFLH